MNLKRQRIVNHLSCTFQCGKDESVTVMLERIGGTLGFNIMGGYTVSTQIFDSFVYLYAFV